MRSTRRVFLGTSGVGLGLLAGASLSWLSGCATTAKGDIMPKRGPRVAVIGGGWGGAKYVRSNDPTIEVILLEPNRDFISCRSATSC